MDVGVFDGGANYAAKCVVEYSRGVCRSLAEEVLM